jgi:hypothetical protein
MSTVASSTRTRVLQAIAKAKSQVSRHEVERLADELAQQSETPRRKPVQKRTK